MDHWATGKLEKTGRKRKEEGDSDGVITQKAPTAV